MPRRRGKGRTRSTMRDIAQEAGVSPTTVSLVLHGRETSRVSPSTRERILQIVRELNYRPNYIARTLVKNESHSIGLVITTLLNPFYAEIAQDIIDRAKETGYGVIACSVRGGLDDERQAVEQLQDRGVDGLVICSCLRRDPCVQRLSEDGIPFVLALRTVEQGPGDALVDCIVVDNVRGGYMAMEHLIRLGHKRIGLIAGPQETSTGHDRLEGAMAALENHGIEFQPELVLYGDFHRRSGFALTKEFLASSKRPTAIFAANDHMAMGVLDALKEGGLQTPEDMAVVGFDDIEMAGLPGVGLTTVSQKKATMGRLAVDRLIEKIREESTELVKRVVLDPILVVRSSCGFYARGGKYGVQNDKGPRNQEKKAVTL